MDRFQHLYATGGMTLCNPDTHEPMFCVKPLAERCFATIECNRHYSVIWVTQGRGVVRHGFSEHSFAASCLLFFSPYQPFVFTEAEHLNGAVLQFAPEFYCVERHRHEISCSGILFNNPYDSPALTLDTPFEDAFAEIIHKITEECRQAEPDGALLLAYLKILLIQGTRLKKQHPAPILDSPNSGSQATITHLIQLIEAHYRTKKMPSEYAEMLHLAPKTVNRLVKLAFNKTLTELIQERVIFEAKRELALTEKRIREIAADLGYDDEYYFSRLFKKLTGVSPAYFRKTYLPNLAKIVHL